MNNNMYFLSLIIPVYNVERYLDYCIKSVIYQKPEGLEIEVILVDDGSTDNSSIICDKYAKRYPYIKVIHKLNKGLSSARNVGTIQASGTYVMYMDSDDWWNPDVDIRKIISIVKEQDQTEMFLFSSYDYVEGDGYYKRREHENLKELKTSNIKQYYQSLLNNGNLEVSACTKILKKSFLTENDLFFKEGLLSEDNEWMLRLLRRLKKVTIIDEPLYICRLNRKGSIANTIRRKNVDDLLTIIQLSQCYYDRNPGDELKQFELCYASYLWFSALGLSDLLMRNDRRQMKGKFYKTSEVCQYSKSPKTRLCYMVYRIAGLMLTAKILGAYIKVKQKRPINRIRIQNVTPVGN